MDTTCINTIRTLAMDAVQQANSGHPGHADGPGPGGLLPVAEPSALRSRRPALAESRSLRALGRPCLDAALFDAAPDRRQGGQRGLRGRWASRRCRSTTSRSSASCDSRCPGHPEYRLTSGVETTTGPARPGGRQQRRHGDRRALAGRPLQPARLRDLFDYNVYAICGDGDMMEGISSEAASLAGHLQARRTSAGSTTTTTSRSKARPTWPSARTSAARFEGYGWNVIHVERRQRPASCSSGRSTSFQKTTDRPTLIIVDSHIGCGSPNKQDTHGAHGEPLGEEEIRLTKRVYGWPEDAKFLVPDGVLRPLPARHRHARQGAARRLARPSSPTTRPSIPSWPTSSTGCSTASCPTAGTRTCRRFPADAKGMATRDVVAARCSTPSPRTCPG